MPNLCDEPPPTTQELTLVEGYTVADEMRCVFGHRHKTGYIIRDEEGRHYPIGHECGAKVFGIDACQQLQNMERRWKNRAFHLPQVRELRAAFARNRNWIADLAKSSSLGALTDLRSRLASRCPKLVNGCRQVIHGNGGQLILRTRYRDRAREERREEREEREQADFAKKSEAERQEAIRAGREPRSNRSPIFSEMTVDGGTLFGTTLFVHDAISGHVLKELTNRIDLFLKLDRVPAEIADLRSLSKNAVQLVKTLLSARTDVAEALAFFDQANLERFAKWADQNKFGGLSCKAGPGYVVLSSEDTGKEFRIDKPDALRPIVDQRFDELEKASRAFQQSFERKKKAA